MIGIGANMIGSSVSEEAFAPFLPQDATTAGVDGADKHAMMIVVPRHVSLMCKNSCMLCGLFHPLSMYVAGPQRQIHQSYAAAAAAQPPPGPGNASGGSRPGDQGHVYKAGLCACLVWQLMLQPDVPPPSLLACSRLHGLHQVPVLM